MSQRSRPGSAQATNDPPRMPIEAAEALLWGKETLNQQQFLYSRMRELEDQHRGYETRIQTTEAIAEAAEAATSRIRNIEQKVAAIVSDEHDRPFDKWAEGEIETFKVFIEKNKNVRQKQIELERQVSSLEDYVDRVKDTSRDVEILLTRIERLEADRMNDADSIKRLQKDVTILTAMRQSQSLEIDQLRSKVAQKQAPRQMLPPPSRRQHFLASDETDHTMTANIFPTNTNRQYIPQVMMLPPSKGPAFETSNATGYVMEHEKSPVEDRRLSPNRMPPPPPPPPRQQYVEDSETEDENIATPYENRHQDREQLQARPSSIIKQKSSSSGLLSSPTKPQNDMSARLRMMQRNSIHDPKRSREVEPQGSGVPSSRTKVQRGPNPNQLPATQLVGRSGVATPTRIDELPSRSPEPVAPTQLIVKLKTGKRKQEEPIPSPRLTRSQAKKIREAVSIPPKAPGTVKMIPTVETQYVKEPAAKRRKPNNPRVTPQIRPKQQNVVHAVPQAASNAAHLVKTSPRKAALMPASPLKKKERGTVQAKPVKPGDGFQFNQPDIRSSSKTASPEKPRMPVRSVRPHERPLPSANDTRPAGHRNIGPQPFSATSRVPKAITRRPLPTRITMPSREEQK